MTEDWRVFTASDLRDQEPPLPSMSYGWDLGEYDYSRPFDWTDLLALTVILSVLTVVGALVYGLAMEVF